MSIRMSNHKLRETPADKNRELKVLEFLAKRWKCDAQQIKTGGKYKFDGFLHRGPNLIALIEIKWYSNRGFYGLNLAKYHELVSLAGQAKTRAIFAFRVPGMVGWIELYNGMWTEADYTVRVTGGTPSGRDPNWDDTEPMVMFAEEQVRWLKTNPGRG